MYVNTCCGNKKVIKKKQLYRSTKIATDISIDYRPTLDRNIERLSSDYRPSVDRPSRDHRPSVDQLSAKCPRKVGEVSVKYRCTKSYIGRDTSGTTIDRLSTVSRPSVDRLSTVISTEYRPIIDRYINRLIGRHSLQ